MQKWKVDSSLHSCERKDGKKVLDYHSTYVDEFLNSDPIRDWESIDRCKYLWERFIKRLCAEEELTRKYVTECALDWKVLDCGTKDGQFPEYLKEVGIKDAIGIEISMDYVEYAQSLDRPVRYGDVCNMPEDWSDRFTVVFSHHLLGLTPDYRKGLDEMWRVVEPGGWFITLNDVPGNPKKHYSLITDSSIFDDFIAEAGNHELLFNGYWKQEFPKEWVLMIRKPIPNNICIKCGKAFYMWYHGQGAVCGDCNREDKDV